MPDKTQPNLLSDGDDLDVLRPCAEDKTATYEESPARMILEYLETHENLTAKEAAAACQLGNDTYARRILWVLEQRGLARRDSKAHRGGQRFTKGRYFARWREYEANGFQTDVLPHRQYEIPGLLKPLMPGLRP